MDWLFEGPIGRIKEDKSKNLGIIHLDNMEQAEYLVDWGVNMSLNNKYPLNYRTVGWNDEQISKDKSFIEKAEKAGFVPSWWGKRLSYHDLATE